MADIFVSYAHQDRPWVARFTGTLQKLGGWDIWWDRSIAPGEQFDEVIQHALEEARCVIVVWSNQSIASRWVKTEARDAAGRGILIPVMIEPLTLPLEFRSFETADLGAWQGEPDHPQLLEIFEVLRAAIAKSPQRPASPVAAPPAAVTTSPSRASEWLQPTSDRSHTRRMWYSIGGGVTAIAIVVALVATYSKDRADEPADTDPTVVGEGRATSAAPELTGGIWTMRNAQDDDGDDFRHSVIKFTSQDRTADGLTVKGLITWRRNDQTVGTETFTGRYIGANRQLFFEGEAITMKDPGTTDILTAGSYSAVLSDDERSLLDGRWGATATARPGVDGTWEAHR